VLLWQKEVLNVNSPLTEATNNTQHSSYESVEDFKKPKYIENIIHEIRQLRKSHKQFTTKAERPVVSIGGLRAHIIIEETKYSDLDKFAIEIAANNFFARTFTIDHK
jgi:hypothetical protein